jgi:hypothetical protein
MDIVLQLRAFVCFDFLDNSVIFVVLQLSRFQRGDTG